MLRKNEHLSQTWQKILKVVWEVLDKFIVTKIFIFSECPSEKRRPFSDSTDKQIKL